MTFLQTIGRTAFVLAALFLLNTPAVAAENLRHIELQRFEEGGGVVKFMGHAYGLDAWLLSRDGQPPVPVYTTKEGGLVQGMLVNPEGKIETIDQLVSLKEQIEGSQAALPGAEDALASKAEKFYAEVERKAAWAEVGKPDAPYIYILVNATCGDCQAYWRDLEAQVKLGNLRVRIVPYGALETNRVAGAALLSSPHPGKSWSDFIAGDQAALAADKHVDGALAALDYNSSMAKRWKLKSVPMTLYRKLTDGKLTAIPGRPKNLMLILADLMPPLGTPSAALVKKNMGQKSSSQEAPGKESPGKEDSGKEDIVDPSVSDQKKPEQESPAK